MFNKWDIGVIVVNQLWHIKLTLGVNDNISDAMNV